MADEPKTPEIDSDEDELLLDDPIKPSDGDELNSDAEGEEDVIGFGDESEPQEGDTGLVKHLRDEIKRARAEAAEARKTARQPDKIEIGEKPTLTGCDYDEEKFEAELDAWKERKAAVERQSAASRDADERQRQAMHAELERVAAEKTALARPDADEAFETVEAALGQARYASLALITDKGVTAMMIYALAKSPDRLAALAAESDPIRFVKEVVKLEGKLKVEKRRKPVDPDTPERGSGRIAPATSDKKLAKLEEEAERTGDRTKIIAYKRAQKQAAAKA